MPIFAANAEREYVTQVAEALEMTQSSISAAVSSLEIEFGTKFFHRLSRGRDPGPADKVGPGHRRFLVDIRNGAGWDRRGFIMS
ncbi:helix-turn-helix domain-containing protein [Acidiphilium sp. MT5]